MLTRPRFAKKSAYFMNLLGLIDQFRSTNFDYHLIRFWQKI